jgi:RNA polymerase sigma factor (sigma-70 family)
MVNASPTVRLVCLESRSSSRTSPDDSLLPMPAAFLDIEADRDRLYAEFAPLVRRLIRQYGQDASMREDLAGEIYCRFCALLEAFDPMRGVPLRPYIVRQLSLATYTYARQQWRIRKREATWEIEEARAEQTAAFDPTADWLASLAQDQAAALLPAALEKLPARQRNVVIWRYYEERSFEDIAELLSVQPTTVRSLLRHGLNNLRKAIGAADCF